MAAVYQRGNRVGQVPSIDMDKLAKVLALADSSNEGEALNAVRAARQMLARAGMSFKDIAGKNASGGGRARENFWEGANLRDRNAAAAAQRQVDSLKLEVSVLQGRLTAQTGETDRWRRQAEELQRAVDRIATGRLRERQQLLAVLDDLRAVRVLAGVAIGTGAGMDNAAPTPDDRAPDDGGGEQHDGNPG